MIRNVLSVLFAAVLLAGCSEQRALPVAPEPTGASLLIDASIDLTTVLEFVELPELTGTRHAEKYIRAAEGGFVELNGFRVEIPAGALPADTLVTIDLPEDALLAKHVVAEFGPHGVQFNAPVTLVFPLEGTLHTGGTLEVGRWENGAWTMLGGAPTADGKSMTGTTPRFSTYGTHVMAGG